MRHTVDIFLRPLDLTECFPLVVKLPSSLYNRKKQKKISCQEHEKIHTLQQQFNPWRMVLVAKTTHPNIFRDNYSQYFPDIFFDFWLNSQLLSISNRNLLRSLL